MEEVLQVTNSMTSIKKTMMFIPTILKDTYLELPFGKVPTLIMIVNGDTINCHLDRKCSCDCENRLERFDINKDDFKVWTERHTNFYRI